MKKARLNSLSTHYIFVAIHGIIAGFIVLGGRFFSDQGMSLYEISVYTLLSPVFIYGLLVLTKEKYRFKRENMGHMLLYGFAIAGTVLAQFGAVVLGTPVAVVAFLLYTQPFWTILLARVLFKERIGKTKVLASALVLAGIIFLIDPFGVKAPGSFAGIAVALFGGFSLSLYVIWGGILSKRGNSVVNSAFGSCFFALVYILLLLPVLRRFTDNPAMVRLSLDFEPWLLAVMAGYSILTETINPLFYLEGIKRVPVTDAGIILLLEPVSGAVLAAVLFHETLTPAIITGAVFIILANYLVIRYGEREG